MNKFRDSGSRTAKLRRSNRTEVFELPQFPGRGSRLKRSQPSHRRRNNNTAFLSTPHTPKMPQDRRRTPAFLGPPTPNEKKCSLLLGRYRCVPRKFTGTIRSTAENAGTTTGAGTQHPPPPTVLDTQHGHVGVGGPCSLRFLLP